MTEENTQRPQSSQESHVAAAQNPEQHLQESHRLSIRLQGKEGPTGSGVWALVRDEKGKVKTLTVYEGTRREAVLRFYRYIHPNKPEAAPSSARRSMPTRSSSRPPFRRSSR